MKEKHGDVFTVSFDSKLSDLRRRCCFELMAQVFLQYLQADLIYGMTRKSFSVNQRDFDTNICEKTFLKTQKFKIKTKLNKCGVFNEMQLKTVEIIPTQVRVAGQYVTVLLDANSFDSVLNDTVALDFIKSKNQLLEKIFLLKLPGLQPAAEREWMER